uniref:Uncharacterized protein n=1 Tax=Ditylenchus dipsaci TaxID=166011 RepID=A0A915E5L9_9BILA
MLYFAYRRLIFNSERKTSAAIPARQWSFRNHIGAAISLNDGGRLTEFDEAWPVRWSVSAVYGAYPTKNTAKTLYLKGDSERKSFKSVCAYACSFAFIQFFDFLRILGKQILCIVLIPCLHYYTCQKNSFSHRHKCSKTFVKYCTFVFHYVMLSFSLVCVFLCWF